jgi:hypothetical protein
MNGFLDFYVLIYFTKLTHTYSFSEETGRKILLRKIYTCVKYSVNAYVLIINI